MESFLRRGGFIILREGLTDMPSSAIISYFWDAGVAVSGRLNLKEEVEGLGEVVSSMMSSNCKGALTLAV